MTQITHAFILAAGFGKRMMPLTAERPKPMVEILGKPIIGYTLDHLKASGVEKVTVNGHYKADVLKEYLETRDDLDITFSYEEEVLDTGGGLVYGLHSMPINKPFFIINGDAYWMNAPQGKTLDQLATDWDEDQMDLLTLLHDKDTLHGTSGIGDYIVKDDGRVKRCPNKDGDYMFAGIRIAHPRIFEGCKLVKFSFLELMDNTQNIGTHFGHIHQGHWYHLSTPEDVAQLEQELKTEPNNQEYA